MSDQQDSPSTSWFQRLPEHVTTAVQMVTAIGGFAYGLGWLITSRFCSHFNVAPEEIGISFGWLVIRAFTISLLSLLVVAGGIFLLRRADQYGSFARIVESRMAVWITIHLVCQAICAIPILGLVIWSGISDTSVPLVVVLAFLATGLVIGTLIVRMIPRDGPLQINWNFRLWLLAVAAGLVSFIVVFLLVLPFPLGDRLAEDVKAGREVRLAILPGIHALEVTKVQLVAPDVRTGSPAGAPASCLMRMGSSNGTSVFYDPAAKRVIRLSDENFTLLHTCP